MFNVEVVKIVAGVAGLAGIGALLAFTVFREILRKNFFPKLTRSQGYRVINRLIAASLVVSSLCIAAWCIVMLHSRDTESNEDTHKQRLIDSPDYVTMPDPPQNPGCPNPQERAVLNYFSVSYTNPAEPCHDFPALSARVIRGGKYPQNQQELEKGVTARAGDVIRVRVYVHNGAAPIGTDPNLTTAKNVMLVTRADSDIGPIHYIKIRFGGDNTNFESRTLTVMTSAREQLQVIPSSGQIRDYLNSDSLLRSDFDIGNNVVELGDIEPCWKHSLFVYYDLKVVSA
ncbi:MAG: hypothetical protein M3362_08815 [Acidobacteriota bacterium]|nr:hypothetical protein [Acidobacteriota bacterium]